MISTKGKKCKVGEKNMKYGVGEKMRGTHRAAKEDLTERET